MQVNCAVVDDGLNAGVKRKKTQEQYLELALRHLKQKHRLKPQSQSLHLTGGVRD